jgi:hypothetical protein
MFWWTEASVACSNISVVVTCKHVDSNSSPTFLPLIGGRRAGGAQQAQPRYPRTPDTRGPGGLGRITRGGIPNKTNIGAAYHQISQQAPGVIA